MSVPRRAAHFATIAAAAAATRLAARAPAREERNQHCPKDNEGDGYHHRDCDHCGFATTAARAAAAAAAASRAAAWAGGWRGRPGVWQLYGVLDSLHGRATQDRVIKPIVTVWHAFGKWHNCKTWLQDRQIHNVNGPHDLLQIAAKVTLEHKARAQAASQSARDEWRWSALLVSFASQRHLLLGT